MFCLNRSVVSVDIDENALEIAKSNSENVDADIEFIKADVFKSFPQMFLKHPIYSLLLSKSNEKIDYSRIFLSNNENIIPFDTVVMNPPFGTRVAGADLFFLRVAVMVYY